jgi:hypothetical protein
MSRLAAPVRSIHFTPAEVGVCRDQAVIAVTTASAAQIPAAT